MTWKVETLEADAIGEAKFYLNPLRLFFFFFWLSLKIKDIKQINRRKGYTFNSYEFYVT